MGIAVGIFVCRCYRTRDTPGGIYPNLGNLRKPVLKVPLQHGVKPVPTRIEASLAFSLLYELQSFLVEVQCIQSNYRVLLAFFLTIFFLPFLLSSSFYLKLVVL